MVSSVNTFDQFPGRVKIENVSIVKGESKVDITSLFIEYQVQASIIDATAISTLTLLDAKNVLSNLPIEAGDGIEIQLAYADTQKVLRSRIVRIGSIINGDRQRTYNIEMISVLAYNSIFNKISRHYRGTTSEMAFSVFEQFTNEQIGVWDTSTNIQSLIVPNWSPIKTIKWMASRSKATFDNLTFRFFQDSNFNYNFMPIERANLLYQEAPITYRFNNVTSRETRGRDSVSNSRAVVETILSLEYNPCFNISKESKHIKNTWFYIDLTHKNQNTMHYNLFENYSESKYLNKSPIWSYDEAGIGPVTFFPYASENQTNIDVNTQTDITYLRKTTVSDGQMIEITVNGNQTIDVGQVVNIEIPSPEPRTDTQVDQKDLRWSGRYYIVAIRNVYSRDGHTTALTLSKDSLVV